MISEKEIDKENYRVAMVTAHSLGLPNRITHDGAIYHNLMVVFENGYNSRYNNLKEDIKIELGNESPSFGKLLMRIKKSMTATPYYKVQNFSPKNISDFYSNLKNLDENKRELSFGNLGNMCGILLAVGSYAYTTPYALSLLETENNINFYFSLIANSFNGAGFDTKFIKKRFKDFEKILKLNFKDCIKKNKEINGIPIKDYIKKNKAEKLILTNLKEITKSF